MFAFKHWSCFKWSPPETSCTLFCFLWKLTKWAGDSRSFLSVLDWACLALPSGLWGAETSFMRQGSPSCLLGLLISASLSECYGCTLLAVLLRASSFFFFFFLICCQITNHISKTGLFTPRYLELIKPERLTSEENSEAPFSSQAPCFMPSMAYSLVLGVGGWSFSLYKSCLK